MEENCISTPMGLKIHLDPIFFLQLWSDETSATKALQYEENMLRYTEFLYMKRNMLAYFSTLVCMIISAITKSPLLIETVIVTAALYMIGFISTFFKPTLLDFTIYSALYMLYYPMRNGIFRYIVLGVIAFFTGTLPLWCISIAVQFAGAIINVVTEGIMRRQTFYKYGFACGRAEKCALHLYELFADIHDNLILEYSAYIKNKETPKPQMENFETKADKFVEFHFLSPIKGYSQEPMEVTDENRDLVNKWIDKETNGVYCVEVYKNGESQFYYTTKEMFNDLRNKFDES